MGSWLEIDRDDLRNAARAAGFDTTFPLLMRRLIAETAVGLTDLDMPGGSGTAVGGYDGVVTATADSTFVPTGTSVWELSVGGGQTKANDDFGKRLEAPPGTAISDVTYVEAILEPWTKARTWASDRTSDGRWRAVRGYNLDRIHAWLDQAPATTVWLGEHLGKQLAGVAVLDTWWRNSWLPSTRVPLDRTILLAGREAAARSLVERLADGEPWTAIGGDLRPDEIRAFVAAALDSSSVTETILSSRTLAVSSDESLRRLVASSKPMVLVLTSSVLARDLPAGHPHQIVVPAMPGDTVDVEIPRVSAHPVEAHLQTLGMSAEEAQRLSVLARRSPLALRRALAEHSGPLTPSWALTPSRDRRGLLLLGAWEDRYDGDREIVASVIGTDYTLVRDAAERALATDDVPFLGQVGGTWHVLAIEDSWTLLGASLTDDELEAAARATVIVLTEPDPSALVDPDTKWLPRSNNRVHSTSLRRGLARTLAIAGGGAFTRSGRSVTGSGWARSVVLQVLDNANADESYRAWASLSDVLELLAEAAPTEFIAAMERGLAGEAPLHAAMFRDGKNDRFGFPTESPHISFLRALEVLAWSPEYVDEAVRLLAELALSDPGGRWANRPAASLAGVFSAWRPNTAADLEHRIRVLDRTVRDYPAISDQLLLDLIPTGHDFQSPNATPTFRNWKADKPVQGSDVRRVVGYAANSLITRATVSVQAIVGLIGKLGDIPPEERARFASAISEIAPDLPEAQRAEVFAALRDEIARHREYADAEWALPEEQLAALQEACEVVEPQSAIRQAAWLFDKHMPMLGDFRRRDNYQEYREEVRKRRRDVVTGVLEESGLDGVLELARGVAAHALVGAALADTGTDHDIEMVTWLGDMEPMCTVASSYFFRRLHDAGDAADLLLDAVLAASSDPLVHARLLALHPDVPRAWTRFDTLDVSVRQHYWREFNYFGLGHDFPGVNHVARSLIEAGRPAAALDLVHLYLRDSGDAETAEIVADGLEAILRQDHQDPEIIKLQGSFDEIFALLARHRNHLGQQRLVTLEWHFFPALRHDDEAPSLHAEILSNPRFFVELVCTAFKTASGAAEEAERDRAFTIRAYSVLYSLNRCPGSLADGSVDAGELRRWVAEANEALKSVDKLEVGQFEMGKLLGHAPRGPDGCHVHEVVRDLLEDLRSDAVERGLSSGLVSSRGIFSRGHLDGGDQERELAASYRRSADLCTAWPRTRRIMMDIAESYDIDAEREDMRAERRHQGLGW